MASWHHCRNMDTQEDGIELSVKTDAGCLFPSRAANLSVLTSDCNKLPPLQGPRAADQSHRLDGDMDLL